MIKLSPKKTLPDNHDLRILETGTKLSSYFNIKDDKNKQHKHDLVSFSCSSSFTCTDCCIGETGRCLHELVVDLTGTGQKVAYGLTH